MRGGRPACVLIAWLAAAPARAQEPPPRPVAVALEWRGADGCLDTAGLYGAVRSRRTPSRASAQADAIIVGRAEPAPQGGWQVELLVADRAGAILGRRSLALADAGCAALREHVALVVAMLVDSSVVERAAPAAPPPPVAREEEWRAADGAVAVLGEVGRLPDEDLGLQATFALSFARRWRGELALSAFPESRAADDSGATTIRWIAGALYACRAMRPLLLPRWWRDFACLGLEAGVMSGRGSGFAQNTRERKVLIDAVLRSRSEIDLVGPLFATIELSGRLAAVRPRFGYEDEAGAFQPLYEPSLAAATFAIGLGAHFR